MASVWVTVHAQLRLRWRGLAAIGLLLGLIGAVALTAAAGARRTQTAYPRLLGWAHASQLDVITGISDLGSYSAPGRRGGPGPAAWGVPTTTTDAGARSLVRRCPACDN